MEAGAATEQMAAYYETQCKLCLIAKTYYSYALKTTNQGVYRNKVWSCTEFARLLHKTRFFFFFLDKWMSYYEPLPNPHM